jgi:chromosome segregation ATPase
MNNRLRLIISAAFAVPLLIVGVASAVDTTTTEGAGTTSTAASETAKPTAAPLSADEQAALQKRLQERTTKLKAKVTATEQQRLQARCKSAQGQLSSLSGKLNQHEQSRSGTYSGLIARLSQLQGRLNGQGIDGAPLQVHIDSLKAQIDTYNTHLATYKQALSDAAAMDCAANPDAFKASLEAARVARTTVRQDATAIKEYVKTSIKPTLASVRTQLETSPKTTGDN